LLIPERLKYPQVLENELSIVNKVFSSFGLRFNSIS